MPRQLRIEYGGAIYHVMNRGDRREAIFHDDFDRKRFVATLSEVCVRTDWQIHAYCLMNNHFHLVVEMPKANLVAGMRWFLSTYTARFNRRHKQLSSETNIMVVQSTLNLTVNPVSDDLRLPMVTVNGGFDDFSDYTVWVNGVKAADNGDGTWTAQGVPLPQNGGTAVIQARAIPNSNNGGNGTGGSGGGPVTYDNLGNPDPPQDNDTEAGTADRPTEVVLESAHWTFDSTENLLSEGAMNNDHETEHDEEFYSHTKGGSVTFHGEVTGTNGVTTPSTSTYTVAPDETTTEIKIEDPSGWSDYTYDYDSDGTAIGVHLTDSSGTDFDYIGSLDNIGIPLELGSLSWQSPITANYNWTKTSQVKYNLHIGARLAWAGTRWWW